MFLKASQNCCFLNYLKQNLNHSPIKTAPAISKTVAKTQACLMVKTPDPTLVPNELATSLAPIPKAKINAIINPRITIQRISDE